MKPDLGYYANQRPDVADLVDDNLLSILDVGCGTGQLGFKLKQSLKSRKIVGVELNPDAASEARNVLDQVIVGDVLALELPFELAHFDCIILADILEHFTEPEKVLQKLKPYLKPSGVMICSIPNMRHYTVILKLLIRGWEYEEYGLFDKTHLRFFSRRSMIELMKKAGFKIEIMKPKIVASVKMKLLNLLMFKKLEDFLATQYIIKARLC